VVQSLDISLQSVMILETFMVLRAFEWVKTSEHLVTKQEVSG